MCTMAERKSDISDAIKIAKEGIDAVNSALGLFNKVLDQIIPWNTFEGTIKKLDRYREDYSNESAEIVGEIKASIADAVDKYFSATQCIYEWCSLASQLLTVYLQLFDERDEEIFQGQKLFLIKILDDGAAKMSDGQTKLEDSTTSFNILKGKLVTLHSRLTNEFDSQSTYFQSKVNQISTEFYRDVVANSIVHGPFGLFFLHDAAAGVIEEIIIAELKLKLDQIKKNFEDLQMLVNKAVFDIDSTKDQLKDKIVYFRELNIQAEESRMFIPFDDLDSFRDNTIESVNKLIVQCNEYQERHGKE